MPGRDQQAVGEGDPHTPPAASRSASRLRLSNTSATAWATFSCCLRPWRDGGGWRPRSAAPRPIGRPEVVRKLVDEDYPNKDRIVLVMDNLNTHHPSSLYQAFEPPEARRIAEPGDSLHAEARELAEHGRDRTGGAGPAVPGPPDWAPWKSSNKRPKRGRINATGTAYEWTGVSPPRTPASN